MRPRGRDRLDDRLPLRALELGELGLELLVGGGRQQLALFVPPATELVAAAAGAAAAPAAAAAASATFVTPCTAKEENCRETFVAAQSGQATCSSPRTSSSKCDSHSMQTYS